MGEENPTPRFDPENPKKRVDAGGAHIDAAGVSAGGETTLDTGGSGAAPAKAVDRMSIGPYVLVKKLGEGGMGQVWLAEQTGPVKRRVALKLIKGGVYENAMIQRFEAERQSLAAMSHPAIAKVFDAGATKDGQPYFVMEYVDGLPITKYCDNKKLKVRERLELFIQVCEGVQHAHQKAIIHRDLKPSNILVIQVDGKPVPRIIDFGLAKAISPQPGGEQTLYTQMGGLVGTRGFMSPEQADPSVLDVDTRTDVYSLGVTLYTLLTGTLPFDPEQWKKKPFDEVLRQLREEDPPSPSTRLSGEKETAKDSATNRGTEPKQLVALLRGDLDWITMKAVEKDRGRRYGAPSELTADLDRYLQNRPVVARPASTAYRARKYVQRHRVGVAVASGAAALLVAFALAQAVQLRRITRERDRADRVTTFMTGMFRVSDPSEARGSTITAREILDNGSKDIETGLAKDPELQAKMMDVMGNVYESLGLYSQAQSLLERAVDIRRRVLGRAHPDTLESISNLAVSLADEGHYSQAEKLDRETLDLQRRVLAPEHPDTLKSMNDLAGNLREEGRYAEAEQLDTETLGLRRRVLGSEHPETLTSMNNLAVDLKKVRKYGQAEKLEGETLEIRRRVLGPEHPQTLASMTNLAEILRLEGKYPESEKLNRQTLEISRRVFGSEHPRTIITLNNLAITLQQQGLYAQSEQLNREALEINRRTLGPEHPGTLASMNNLAIDLKHEGKFAESERLNRQTLEIRRRVSGPEHPDTIGSMDNLLNSIAGEHHYAEAEKLVRQILDIKRRVFGPDDISTADAAYDLGCFLAIQGKREEALSVLHNAVDHGLRPAGLIDIQTNADLKSLRGDPRFKAIVADAKQRAAALQKPN